MPQASVSARVAGTIRWPEALLAVVLALWTAAVLVPELPWAKLFTLGRGGWTGVIIVPVALAGALLLRPRDRALRAACAAAGMVLAVNWLIPWAAREPELALGVPALAVAALVAARLPIAVLGVALLFSGFSGTIDAHTSLPPRILADGALLALALALGWKFLVDRRASRPVRVWPAVWLFAAYVLASVIAAVASPDPNAAFQGFRHSQFYMLVAVLLCIAGWDPERRTQMLKLLIAINLAVAAYAIYRDIAGASEEERRLALATLRQYNLLDGELRLVGSFVTGSDLAAWTVVGAPLCLAAGLALRGRWRWIAGIAAAMSTYVLIATGVRTGFVGLVAAALLTIALFALGGGFRGPRLLVAGGALVVVLIGGGVALQVTVVASPTARERFEKLLDPGNDESLVQRQRKWAAAIDEAGGRPFGAGLGTSGTAAIRFSRLASVNRESIDSAYLKVFVEQGPVGLALFVAALLGLLATLAHAALRARGPTQGAMLVAGAAMLAGAFVVYYAGVFSEGLTSMHSWLVLGLALSELSSTDP